MSGFNARKCQQNTSINFLVYYFIGSSFITVIKCHFGIIIIKLRGEMCHIKFIAVWAPRLCWPQWAERAKFIEINASLFPFILVLCMSHVEISNYQAWFVSAIAFLPGVTGCKVVFTIPCVSFEVQKKKRKHSHWLSIACAVNLVYSLMLYNEIHLDLETSNSENLIISQYFMLGHLVTPLPGFVLKACNNLARCMYNR